MDYIKRFRKGFMLMMLLASVVSPHLSQARGIHATSVFPRHGSGKYECYRIPAIVTLKNGDLVAFAEGRPKGCPDFGEIDIVMKKSTDGGETWSPITVVASNGNPQTGNSVPIVDNLDPRYPDGRIFLFYNTGSSRENAAHELKVDVREQWVTTSTDQGKTWTPPENITAQTAKMSGAPYRVPNGWRGLAGGPGHGLQHSSGRIMVATNIVTTHHRTRAVYMFYSDDHGNSYHMGEPLVFSGINEATAAELSNGDVMINARDQTDDSGFRIVAVSHDKGEHFGAASLDTNLPDPVCEGSLLNIVWHGKKYLAFSNPGSQENRDHLIIRVSEDDGITWPHSIVVTRGHAAYSDLTQVDAEHLGILYENGGKGIRFMKLPLSKIITH